MLRNGYEKLGDFCRFIGCDRGANEALSGLDA